MRIRGLQEVKISFKANERDGEDLIDALLQEYGKFEIEITNKTYELVKIVPIIIEKFHGDEIDSPYTSHDSPIKVNEVLNFIERWDSRYKINDISVTEEIGEEE